MKGVVTRGRLWILLIVIAATACGDDGNPGGPSGGSGGSGSNRSMSATIDGSAWAATSASLVPLVQSGFLALAGTNASGNITLGFGVTHAPGTYAVGASSTVNSSLVVVTGTTGQGWFAGGGSFGNGSVTVTTATPSSAAGSFTFTLIPTPGTGATGNKVVTNGVFNVTF